MMVDAVETEDGAEAAADVAAAPQQAPSAVTPAPQAAAPPPPLTPEQIQQIADSTRDIFSRASQPPRWPMYVRQLKQFIRGVDPNFDERKWGFGTIMEFLRVCQREGLLRLERDRRGQIRVFPGATLQSASAAATMPAQIVEEEHSAEVYEAQAMETPSGSAAIDTGTVQLQPDVDAAAVGAQSPAVELIELDEAPARVKTRRVRRTSTAGKPAVRKSTGVRTSTRRRKAPAA
jgi:hypothetical protein